MNVFVFFFFQAEDGIRDYKVTGVQTCALPICSSRGGSPGRCSICWRTESRPRHSSGGRRRGTGGRRSEERRVGKEGRSRGAPDHLKKKKKKQEETRSIRHK